MENDVPVVGLGAPIANFKSGHYRDDSPAHFQLNLGGVLLQVAEGLDLPLFMA